MSEVPLYSTLRSARHAHDAPTTPSSLCFRGPSLITNCPPLGPYRRPMPGALGESQGEGLFLMHEVTLYRYRRVPHAARVYRGTPHIRKRPPT